MSGSGCAWAMRARAWGMSSTWISPSRSTGTRASSTCSSWCRPRYASRARPGSAFLSGNLQPRPAAGGTGVRAAAGLRRQHVDGQREGALLGARQHTDVHHLPRNFLAAVVADRDDDVVLPRLLQRWVADDALDLQRRGGRHLALRRVLVEAQVVHAARADAQALKDRGLTVRTGARLARGHRTRGDAHALPKPLSVLAARASPS